MTGTVPSLLTHNVYAHSLSDIDTKKSSQDHIDLGEVIKMLHSLKEVRLAYRCN